jgi:hypothetical protein
MSMARAGGSGTNTALPPVLSRMKRRKLETRVSILVGRGWRFERAILVEVEAMGGAEDVSIGDQRARTHIEGAQRIEPSHKRDAIQVEAKRGLPRGHDVAARYVGRDNAPCGLNHEAQREEAETEVSQVHLISSFFVGR